MKKIILFSLIAVASLTACRKKKTQIKSGIDQITAVLWHTTLEQYEYFDVNNKLTYNRKNTPGAHHTFIKNNVSVNSLKGVITNGTYAVANKSGKDYITVTLNGVTEEYVLVSVTNLVMIWTQEKTNQTYQQNGTQKVAARKVTTIKFHCPCPE